MSLKLSPEKRRRADMSAVRARLGVVPIVSIKCDGRVPYLSHRSRPCLRQRRPEVGTSVNEIRVLAKAEGWNCTRGHDLCPDCNVVVSRVLDRLAGHLRKAVGRVRPTLVIRGPHRGGVFPLVVAGPVGVITRRWSRTSRGCRQTSRRGALTRDVLEWQA